jgi:hypothetical protein
VLNVLKAKKETGSRSSRRWKIGKREWISEGYFMDGIEIPELMVSFKQ